MKRQELLNKLKAIDDVTAQALSEVLIEANETLHTGGDADITTDDFGITIHEALTSESDEINIDLVDINADKSVCTINIKFKTEDK